MDIVVFQSLSHVQLLETPWTIETQTPVILYLPEFDQIMSIKSVMPSKHLILCPPLLLLPSIVPSIRVFSNKSALCIRWPSASASVLPVNIEGLFSLGLTGLISLLSKELSNPNSNLTLQHHSLKASVLKCSAFFMVHISHSYMITGKTIALTIPTFVSKVISLLFNTLSRFAITFLPRNKCF